tara:strand:- start:331 stop:543 length:213 start_codon:yes stop_codon:yes gene_type:complete
VGEGKDKIEMAQASVAFVRALARHVLAASITGVFCYCIATGIPLGEGFYGIYGAIIGFYFKDNQEERQES